MPESKRLAALKALTEHIKSEVSTINGYQHDLANAVFRGRFRFDDDDPLPMVAILESLNPDRFPNRAGDEDQLEVEQRDKWTIEMQGWTVDDKDNPTDPAYELMADVKKALAKLFALDAHGNAVHDNYLLGGLIAGLEFEAGTVRPPEQPTAKAFFWMRVILEFVENVNDPFDHR